MENFPILTALIFLPFIGAILLFLIPGFQSKRDSLGERSRLFATFYSLLPLLLCIKLICDFDSQSADFQFIEKLPWIGSFGISYFIGVDGISLFLVLLTMVLMPVVYFSSHSISSGRRAYLANMFILQTAMVGTLLALDVFLFYVFWELMLAPMYFIIGIWGGRRKIYATMKFVLYTVAGSLLMLLAILYVVWVHFQQTGDITFAIDQLVFSTQFSSIEGLWLFAAFALAFGIKVPIFPFHTWLPDAHVEAPTGGSVVLAGVLLKMGLYGFIRFAYPLFPDAAAVFAPVLGTLAVIGILYGAMVAWAQNDIKKLVAYSSVSHLGYCVLGLVALNVAATSGSIYQMLNHGVSTGALFLIVGVLYDRRHTREISEYGGLASQVPVFAFLFLIFTLSSIGLPLTNGFIGEFLILSGSFSRYPWLTSLAVLGVILGAVYMLSLYLRIVFGELNEEKNGLLQDVNRKELIVFIPLLLLVFYMGIFPSRILQTMEPSVEKFIQQVEQKKVLVTEGGLGGRYYLKDKS